jgi:AraC family transcriptional activator of pobA
VLVSFENFHELSFIDSNDPNYVKIAYMLSEISDELFANKPEKNAILHASFLKLFIRLIRLCQSNEIYLPGDGNKTLTHFRHFQSMIKKAGAPHSIPYFSSPLVIRTVHLNRICNQVSGKSALFHVEGYKIETAKNYLAHTSYSISEIAYLLDFEYPNYFERLFKKMTGLTPTGFRNQKRG